MKICDNHWKALRAAIEERGLAGFISKDAEAAVQNLTAAFQDSPNKDAFDPLMQASFAIWGNAIQAFGIEIIAANAPCPLCAMDNHAMECKDANCNNESGSDWIKFAADDQLENAREMGLLGEPN